MPAIKKWDCYSPYPIHGLDDAMGLKKSILPYFVFCGGTLGIYHSLYFGLHHAGGDLPDGGAGEAGQHLYDRGFLPDHV